MVFLSKNRCCKAGLEFLKLGGVCSKTTYTYCPKIVKPRSQHNEMECLTLCHAINEYFSLSKEGSTINFLIFQTYIIILL